jgi:hypothetical protein
MNDEYRSLESQFFPFVFVSLLAKQVPWTLDTCTQRKMAATNRKYPKNNPQPSSSKEKNTQQWKAHIQH